MMLSLNLGVTENGEMLGLSVERLASRGAEELRHQVSAKAITDPHQIELEVAGTVKIAQKWECLWREYHRAPTSRDIGMDVDGTPMEGWIERSPQELTTELRGRSVSDWARTWFRDQASRAQEEARLNGIPRDWHPEHLANGDEYFAMRTEDQGDWIIRAIPDLMAVAGCKPYLPLQTPQGKCHIVANSGRVAPLPDDCLEVILGSLISNQLASLWPVMPREL